MTTTTALTLSDLAATGIVAALVTVVLGLLERTHRRTGSSPRALSRTPFGADREGDADIRRTLAELRAVEDRRGAADQARDGAATPTDARSTSTGTRRTLRAA